MNTCTEHVLTKARLINVANSFTAALCKHSRLIYKDWIVMSQVMNKQGVPKKTCLFLFFYRMLQRH